ncbi:MAG: ParA family protein [Lachnospiraceae bacterium]|nr:ParA family protein [Lachnospiraceae bacterium]
MKIITLWNQKGGVGKTTISFNLGTTLSNRGNKVLFIDLDPQSNLTYFFDPEIKNLKLGKADVKKVIEEEKTLKSSLYKSKRFSNISYLRGCYTEVEFPNVTTLRERISEVEDEFDYVIIDCHPDFHKASMNALYAADMIIVPVLLDGFSVSNLNLVTSNLLKIEDAKGGNINYRVVVNRLSRTKDKREKLDDLYNHHDYPLFNMCLGDTSKVNSALSVFKPLSMHRRSSGIAEDFNALTNEVVERLGE